MLQTQVQYHMLQWMGYFSIIMYYYHVMLYI